MLNAVGIRFRQAGKIYTFNSLDYDINVGDPVIVETIRGKEMGFCAKRTTPIDESLIDYELKPILRIATEEDKVRYRENVIKSAEAYKVCKDLIKKHELPMKLTDCNYTFDNHKLLFYFTADDRIDFRALVKDLAYIYKTRIELRQIGIRDGAKILGGIGSCGHELCCKNWISDFNNVTIKMAKDQNIALTPSRISGICGRLLCCLNYEEEYYEEKMNEMPKAKALVKTPKGLGTVIYTNLLTEEITVQLQSDDGSFSQETFKISDGIREVKDKNCNCPNSTITMINPMEELKYEEDEFGEIAYEEDVLEVTDLDTDDLDVEKKDQNESKKEFQKTQRKDRKPREKRDYKNKDKFEKDKKENDERRDFKNKRGYKNFKREGDRQENRQKREDKYKNRQEPGNRRSKRLIDRELNAKRTEKENETGSSFRKIQNEGDDSK